MLQPHVSKQFDKKLQPSKLTCNIKEIYRDGDKPYYYTGNKVLVSISAASVVVILTHREVLRYINRKKKKAWDGLSEVEQRDYDRVQGHGSGNKSLTFSFSY